MCPGQVFKILTLSSHDWPVWVGASAPGLRMANNTQDKLHAVKVILWLRGRGHRSSWDYSAAWAVGAVETVDTAWTAWKDVWPELKLRVSSFWPHTQYLTWWHLDPAEEIGRADRERGPTAIRAKSIPYLRPTSARRRDMIWKCKILHGQLNINAGIFWFIWTLDMIDTGHNHSRCFLLITKIVSLVLYYKVHITEQIFTLYTW